MQIAQVDQRTSRLADDDDRVAIQDSIEQQHDRSADAQIPKGQWNDAGLFAFAGDPLHQEAHEKNRLSEKTQPCQWMFGSGQNFGPPARVAQLRDERGNQASGLFGERGGFGRTFSDDGVGVASHQPDHTHQIPHADPGAIEHAIFTGSASAFAVRYRH
jgi:hypothetical protein